MKATEQEILEWDSTKKQKDLIELGDFLGCLKVSQSRFYWSSFFLFLQGALFGSAAIWRVTSTAGDLSEAEAWVAGGLAFLVVVYGAQFGYRLAKSQLKEKCLEAMITAKVLPSVADTPLSKA
jgi:hypothetical protein